MSNNSKLTTTEGVLDWMNDFSWGAPGNDEIASRLALAMRLLEIVESECVSLSHEMEPIAADKLLRAALRGQKGTK